MSTELEAYGVLGSELGTKSATVTLALRGFGDSGDDDHAENQAGVEWPQPLGLLARPKVTATTEALCLWAGDRPVAVVVIDKGAPKIADLEEGETRLQGLGATPAVIRLRADGHVEITAAAGQDVVVNGGLLRVARETDGVNASTALVTWFAAIQTATGVAPPFGAIGAISGGAAHFKG